MPSGWASAFSGPCRGPVSDGKRRGVTAYKQSRLSVSTKSPRSEKMQAFFREAALCSPHSLRSHSPLREKCSFRRTGRRKEQILLSFAVPSAKLCEAVYLHLHLRFQFGTLSSVWGAVIPRLRFYLHLLMGILYPIPKQKYVVGIEKTWTDVTAGCLLQEAVFNAGNAHLIVQIDPEASRGTLSRLLHRERELFSKSFGGTENICDISGNGAFGYRLFAV